MAKFGKCTVSWLEVSAIRVSEIDNLRGRQAGRLVSGAGWLAGWLVGGVSSWLGWDHEPTGNGISLAVPFPAEKCCLRGFWMPAICRHCLWLFRQRYHKAATRVILRCQCRTTYDAAASAIRGHKTLLDHSGMSQGVNLPWCNWGPLVQQMAAASSQSCSCLPPLLATLVSPSTA